MFTFRAGHEKVYQRLEKMNVGPLPTYLHSSGKHGDRRGRPYESVGVGFSLEYPATLNIATIYCITPNKALDGAEVTVIYLPSSEENSHKLDMMNFFGRLN